MIHHNFSKNKIKIYIEYPLGIYIPFPEYDKPKAQFSNKYNYNAYVLRIPRSLTMNKFQTRSPINELGQDLDLRYIPTNFDRDRRRIAPRREVTGFAGQND